MCVSGTTLSQMETLGRQLSVSPLRNLGSERISCLVVQVLLSLLVSRSVISLSQYGFSLVSSGQDCWYGTMSTVENGKSSR